MATDDHVVPVEISTQIPNLRATLLVHAMTHARSAPATAAGACAPSCARTRLFSFPRWRPRAS